MLASRWVCRAQDEPKLAEVGPKRAPGIIVQDFIVVCRPVLGPSWARLGLPWGLLGPSWGVPGGPLEADFGFGRLDLGVQGG